MKCNVVDLNESYMKDFVYEFNITRFTFMMNNSTIDMFFFIVDVALFLFFFFELTKRLYSISLLSSDSKIRLIKVHNAHTTR